MKKLFLILMSLCLLCCAAAPAEEKAPAWDDMPLVVTVDEGTELTDADFEGDWVLDKVFYETVYMTPEEVKENGLEIHPMRIADGKVTSIFTDEQGEHETPSEYTLESNQLLVTDEDGVDAVFEKLEDGNLVMSIFLPGQGEIPVCVSFFLVHP